MCAPVHAFQSPYPALAPPLPGAHGPVCLLGSGTCVVTAIEQQGGKSPDSCLQPRGCRLVTQTARSPQPSPLSLVPTTPPGCRVSLSGSFTAACGVLGQPAPFRPVRWGPGPCLTRPVARRVDVDADRRISAKEMQRWIVEKTAEHFQEAVGESRAHFRAVDPDGDGAALTPTPVGLANRDRAVRADGPLRVQLILPAGVGVSWAQLPPRCPHMGFLTGVLKRLNSPFEKCSLFSGRVSWDEYKVKFLASKGHSEREVAEKIKNDQELKVDEESECRAPGRSDPGPLCGARAWRAGGGPQWAWRPEVAGGVGPPPQHSEKSLWQLFLLVRT